ncbi:MAG TPA: hypothetical protein VMS12_10460 [Thermoanaerobaculia bacterium]|nr:hypothetical protein [Thermoanaerobaculia bacterium]
MSSLIFNIILGLIPTIALAWSIAADERKPADEKVVASSSDRRDQNIIFALVYGLWGFTMAMWNWMNDRSTAWIIAWLAAGVLGLIVCRLLVMRRRSMP